MASVSAPGPVRAGWRLRPLVDLAIEVFDGRCVIFEATAGETTLAEPLEAAVLTAFESGAVSDLDALVGGLAEGLSIPVTPALSAEISTVVADFERRGWLESATLAG